MEAVDCVVIGAGWTGLATAAALRSYGVSSFVLLEAGSAPGHFWSSCYERIRLHSPWHGLPCDGGLSFYHYSMFKPKAEVLDYLRKYHALHGLEEYSRFGERVTRIRRDVTAGLWLVDTERSRPQTESHSRSLHSYSCHYVAVCTSKLRVPHIPDVPGMDKFEGQLMHSHEYRTGRNFASRDVVVIGSGNSAAEIAADLVEHRARSVTMIVHGPRHFLPPSRFGVLMRILRWLGAAPSVEERVYSNWLVPNGDPDFDNKIQEVDASFARLAVDMSAYGIAVPKEGILSANVHNGRFAVFDQGAISLIRRGQIRVVNGRPQRFATRGVELQDGTKIDAEAVVLATGFKPALEELFGEEDSSRLLRTGQAGKGCGQRWATPLTDGRGRSTVESTLFFVGFDQAVNGGLSMGFWGWHTGFVFAQELGVLPSGAVFDLNALPERQRDVRRRHDFTYTARALAFAIVAAVVALGVKAPASS